MEFENITKTKRYFLNDKGLVYKNNDLNLVNSKLDLNEELFSDDALVLNDTNIKNVILKNKENKNFIKVEFENFPYLGIWSKPSGAPFLCIEPWFGVADGENCTSKIEEKRGILALEKEENFSCFYSIEV